MHFSKRDNHQRAACEIVSRVVLRSHASLFIPAAMNAGGKHSGTRTSLVSLEANPAETQISHIKRVRPFSQIASHWKRSRFEQAPSMRAEATIARRDRDWECAFLYIRIVRQPAAPIRSARAKFG